MGSLSSKEFAAGGIVRDKNRRLLLVQVKNLEGKIVWTFPKGHREKGETYQQTAVREVREETGWQCRIKRSLTQVKYQFRRGRKLVRKTVRWYLMRPLLKVGKSDPAEIRRVRWASRTTARRLLRYPSDFKILQSLVIVAAVILFIGCVRAPEVVLPTAPIYLTTHRGHIYFESSEGGMVGFRTEDGKKYHLHGEAADKLLSAFVSPELGEISIVIEGFLPEGWPDPHTTSVPFWVTRYYW